MSSLAFHLCAVARCGEHFERAAAIGLAGSARPHDHMCKIISTIQVTMSAIHQPRDELREQVAGRETGASCQRTSSALFDPELFNVLQIDASASG
jgi:hypothetical protein